MQDKQPLNDKDQQHGQWEVYYHNGNLMYKGTYLKGEYIGLWIWGIANGLIEEIEFYAR